MFNPHEVAGPVEPVMRHMKLEWQTAPRVNELNMVSLLQPRLHITIIIPSQLEHDTVSLHCAGHWPRCASSTPGNKAALQTAFTPFIHVVFLICKH